MSPHNLNNSKRGQAALETAIILIAFVIVAAVFAFTILSADTPVENGDASIYTNMDGVQSSMSAADTVIASSNGGHVDSVTFVVSLVDGGEPVDLTTDGNLSSARENAVIVSYRDAVQFVNEVAWTLTWIDENNGNNLLEDNERAEITVDLTELTRRIGANTNFTIEIKPPVGAILIINRTSPTVIESTMELR